MAETKVDKNELSADIIGGWISPGEIWTYASASTFTVSGDKTTTYTKGTRLKWTQTTVKYGVVTGSSYSDPNTTVTIAVNTDYTIANAAISDNYYSYAANPQGYPAYFNYTPVVTAPGGTAPSYSSALGKYQVIGGFVLVNIKLQNSSGGTAGSGTVPLFCTHPITAAETLVLGHGTTYESGGTFGVLTARTNDSSTFYFHKYDFVNLTANDQSSAARYLGFELNYPMA